ncbi:hypothetical protein R83H12_01285 [Fibrobacteria bacterium R8-3-H12]
MTGLSIPEAIVISVALICITVFITAVTLKGMDYGLKEWIMKHKE